MYATWPMRGTGLLRYIGFSEHGTFAAVDAKNRSLRKGSTPPGLHVVMDLPRSLCRALARGHGTGIGVGLELELPPPADACLCVVTPTAGSER